MGTVPIYWGEAADFSELIGGESEPHWARQVLERQYCLAPLDFLDEEALAGHSRLLLAQPRGLAPAENVALDAWVRRGGRLLLFADPMMTGHSLYGIGDRRRPQDVALLSPILRHWGLELAFDPDQPGGLQTGEFAGRHVPVNLAGQVSVMEPDAGEGASTAQCTPESSGVGVHCRLGEGSIVVLADAALLDHDGPWAGAPEALEYLADLAFCKAGEIAGEALPEVGRGVESGRHPCILERERAQEDTSIAH